MTDFVTKSSGEKIDFSGGGQRDSEAGKPRFDLIRPKNVPYADQMLTRFAALMARGAERHSSRNWEQFCTEDALDRAKSSAGRHFEQWVNGEVDEDHASAVWFNIMAAEYVKGVLDGRWPALGTTRSALRELTRSADEDGLLDEGTGFIDTRPWPAIGELVNPGFGEPDRAGYYDDSDPDQRAVWYHNGFQWGYEAKDGGEWAPVGSWDYVDQEFGLDDRMWPWKRIS